MTDLQPGLPSILCFPSELNQAILNILVNAAQAIEETPEGRGTITIRSFREQALDCC